LNVPSSHDAANLDHIARSRSRGTRHADRTTPKAFAKVFIISFRGTRQFSVRRRRRKKKTPADQRQRGKLKVGVNIPSTDEIRAIIAKLNGRWRPLLLTAIFTGLRASELRGLRWADIDLKRNEIHVRQRANCFNEIGPTKSTAGERTIPIPPMLANTLREWKLTCPKGELGLAFPNGAGRIETHSNITRRGLQPVQIAAGVTSASGGAKYPGLHAFRHFYASWCINRSVDGGLALPLKMVQARLGPGSRVIAPLRLPRPCSAKPSGIVEKSSPPTVAGAASALPRLNWRNAPKFPLGRSTRSTHLNWFY
jgi:integrase